MAAIAPFTHADIDRRIRRLVGACVDKIDNDVGLLQDARRQVGLWSNPLLRQEWERFLSLPWPELRTMLLADDEEGKRIRQSAPFGGFLTDTERMALLKPD